MKRNIFISIILTLIVTTSFGQKMKYREIKDDYTKEEYRIKVEDPMYSSALAVVGHTLLPGVGHLYVGEPLRGLVFTAISHPIALGTIVLAYGESSYALVGLGAAVLVYYWAISDVVKIVKIKNVAYSERYKQSISINLQPCIRNEIPNMNTGRMSFGISATISF